MAIDINKEFDEIIYDLTGKEITLDKSDKIVYDDIQNEKVNLACSSFEEFTDLYYKDTVTMNLNCKCGMSYSIFVEPDNNNLFWTGNRYTVVEEIKKRDNFYCLKCGIPISIAGGIIKNIKIKEFKGNIDD